MRVLVVDDNATNRKVLRVMLNASRHEVVEAADGIEALEKLRSESFDAAFADILMPQMDGYRLCQEARSDPVLNDLPIVVYTSTYTSDSDEEVALSVGADFFLRKPATGVAVLDALDHVIRNRHRRRAPVTPVDELDVLKEYSASLVRKLEQRNVELEGERDRLAATIGLLHGTDEGLRALVAFAPIGIYRSTREGRVVFANQALGRILGYESEDDLLRLDMRKDVFFDGAERDRLIAQHEHEHERGVTGVEVRWKRRDGSPVWVSLDWRGIRGSSEGVESFEGFVRDVQQRRARAR